jgi:hypothetical protein
MHTPATLASSTCIQRNVGSVFTWYLVLWSDCWDGAVFNALLHVSVWGLPRSHGILPTSAHLGSRPGAPMLDSFSSLNEASLIKRELGHPMICIVVSYNRTANYTNPRTRIKNPLKRRNMKPLLWPSQDVSFLVLISNLLHHQKFEAHNPAIKERNTFLNQTSANNYSHVFAFVDVSLALPA